MGEKDFLELGKNKTLYVFMVLDSYFWILKGAQAWDIRRRVFYAVQACMGRWLRN